MGEAGLWRIIKTDGNGAVVSKDWSPEAKQLFPSLEDTHNIFEIGNATEMSLFWLLMFYLAKHGQSSAVRDIILKMFEGTFSALKTYMAQAGDNRITAWGCGRLMGLTMERLGLLSQAQAADHASGLSIATGFEVAAQFKSLVPWAGGLLAREDDGFPDQKTTVINEAPSSATRGDITLEKKP